MPSRKSVLSGVHAQGQAAHVSGDSMVAGNQLCCMDFLQTPSSPILERIYRFAKDMFSS